MNVCQNILEKDEISVEQGSTLVRIEKEVSGTEGIRVGEKREIEGERKRGKRERGRERVKQ